MKVLSKHGLLIVFAIIIVFIFGLICMSYKENVSVPDDAKYYNGHMYSVFKSDVSWKQAEYFCRKKGGHLATITDEKENNFVVSLINEHKNVDACWVGTYCKTDKRFSRDYIWIDDEHKMTNRVFPMMRFGADDYFCLTRTGRWRLNQADFCIPNGYVCEWEIGKVTGIRQSDSSNSFVKLTWTDTRLAAGYIVYCYDTALGRYVEYKKVRKPSIIVRGLQSGRAYRFAVCMTINNDGKEKELAKAYFSAVTEPERVVNLNFMNKTDLSWSPVRGADGYTVYLYNNDHCKWEKIDTVRNHSYEIGRKIGSDSQQYKVRAFKKSTDGKKFYGGYSNIVKR